MHAHVKLGAEADAEEVVQDVFAGLWKRRATLVLQHSFHTYISAVVKYEVLRRLAVRRTKDVFEQERARSFTETDNSTQQWLNYEDLREQIEATVQALPEKCRLVFRLSREEGLSERQIAEVLSISQKTVEAHKSRALKALRHSLAHLLHFFL